MGFEIFLYIIVSIWLVLIFLMLMDNKPIGDYSEYSYSFKIEIKDTDSIISKILKYIGVFALVILFLPVYIISHYKGK